ncbi:MAG: glycosyltransferase family 4 protein [Patescibacteria group bacterium]
MKILMLTPYLPFPLMSGGQTRSYNLIKNLSKKHDITLFSLIKNDQEKKYIPELKKYCKKVFVFNRSKTPWTLRNILLTGFGPYPFLVIRNLAPDEKLAVKKELEEEKYDIIHAETFYVMPHIPDTNVPILLVEQTIEYLVYKHYVRNQAPFLAKIPFSIDIMKLKFWETHFWKQANRVVAMSESDKKEMLSLAPKLNIDIVPNGIDIDYFSAKPREEITPAKVLYVGNFKWIQNVEAANILVNEVWPKIKKETKNVKLWIVGMNITDKLKEYASDDIEISEALPDIREAYSKASVLVAPIKGPGGTRLKILEAMASSLPVVTTSVGAEGLGVINEKEALISDQLDEVSKNAIKVLKDKNLSKRLGLYGKKFVESKYTWDKSAQVLDNIYSKVINEK